MLFRSTWRLRARDILGNFGAFSAPSNEVLVDADGGVQVTPPDAGTSGVDAGTLTPRTLRVGCGCSASPAGAWLLFLALVSARRRRQN